MEIYTLTGPAGTGKSYQAMNLCNEYRIDGLIDDGLFIYRNRMEAGISAKRQKTKVGAIKTALFTSDRHKAMVLKSIRRVKPEKLLVIGTSDKMADKILERLELHQPDHRIHIEDITTEEERDAAEKQRMFQGKHVIPVPTLQLKRDFAGYFIDPLRILKSGSFSGNRGDKSEKTVVRPTYSYMGDFYISDLVINDIAKCVAEGMNGVIRILRVYENTLPDALSIYVSVSIRKKAKVWDEAIQFQKKMKEMVEYMTAFNVVQVDVDVRHVFREGAGHDR